MKEKIVEALEKAGEKGVHVTELYRKFPGTVHQSVRGRVLELVHDGKAERISEGVYRVK
jgi:hypothetical protein